MIIGLAGLARSGKDTVGKYLVENYGFTRYAFADSLKDAAAVLLDIPREDVDRLKMMEEDCRVITMGDEHWRTADWGRELRRVEYSNISFRHFLQRFGTEVGRKMWGEDFWTSQVMRVILSKPETHKAVITDVRFPNEILAVRKVLGEVWHLVRPETERVHRHSSEMLDFDNTDADVTIINDSSFEDLYKWVDEALA